MLTVASDGSDSIAVTSEFTQGAFAQRIFVNGVSSGISSRIVERIEVLGGPGDNVLSVVFEADAQLDVLTSVFVDGGAGSDTITAGIDGFGSVTRTLTGGPGIDSVTGSEGVDVLRSTSGIDLLFGGGGDDLYEVDFSGLPVQAFVQDSGGSTDRVEILASDGDDQILARDDFVRVNGSQVDYGTGVEVIDVDGASGSDVIVVRSSVTTAISVHGQSPGSDTLLYDTLGESTNQGPGTIETSGRQVVSHSGFEVLCVVDLERSTDCNLNGIPDECDPNLTPQFTQSPSDLRLCAGQPATFTAVATGIEPITYQWRKDGVPIVGATSTTLSFPFVLPSDEASYDVLVRSPCGASASSPADLFVGLGPRVTLEPVGDVVLEGGSVTFAVDGVGVGTISVVWRKDGSPVPGGNLRFLTLDELEPEDAGVYDALLTDECGTVVSAGAVLDVEFAPRVTSSPQSGPACVGQTLMLSVMADGTAPLAYQWRKDGQSLSGETTPSLSVASFEASDAGSYDVVITNAFGSVTTGGAMITSAVTPTIVSQPSGAFRCERSTVVFEAVAAGTEPLIYQWRKDGTPIDGANHSVLTLSAIEMSDAGFYDVVVTNLCGSVASFVANLGVTECGVVRYVDRSAGGLKNGSDWSSAYRDLEEALLDASVSGNVDEIWVAEGVYTPGTSPAATYSLVDAVSVYGGFPPGGGDGTFGARDPAVRESVLSGDLNGDDGAGGLSDNAFHVLTALTTTESTLLDGLVIESGRAVGAGVDGFGGGLSVTAASLTVRGCEFRSNHATDGGAIALLAGGEVVLEGCVLWQNGCDNSGAAVFSDTGDGVFRDCLFEANVSASLGGGAFIDDGSPLFERCTFRLNRVVAGLGAGVCLDNGTATFQSCMFDDNMCDAGDGAGMYILRGIPIIDACTFVRNRAPNGSGGGIALNNSQAIVVNSLFAANNAAAFGGGFFGLAPTAPSVLQCTFVGNIASNGGGLATGFASTTSVGGCIFWGNLAVSNPQISGNTTAIFCDVQGGYPGMGNIDADPRFIDDRGADLVPFSGDEDLRLSLGSPCVDAGSNGVVPMGFVTDLAGGPRFVDDPGTPDTGEGMAPVVDIGAYERDEAPCPCDTVPDGEITILDLLEYLDGWLEDDLIADYALPLDGVITVLDLLAYLECWLARCV